MDLTSFENFIMDCCRLNEWDLRTELKQLLADAGFTYKEDNYQTRRIAKNPRYKTVHNLLFTRGENPAICLVAHTDVCRDHWRAGEDCTPPEVKPVIKEVELITGDFIRIIQDQDCEVQVGGDDRLGVAINTWIALNTGYEMSLLFTTDEEIGLVSAKAADFAEFNNFKLFCQVDRGNRSHQLVTSISGRELVDPRLASVLLSIASEMNLPRTEVDGLVTDVYMIKGNFPKIQAVNMTCGYHNSHSANASEFIHIEEARDTMHYVSQIIKQFDLTPELTKLAEEVIKEEELNNLMRQQAFEAMYQEEEETEETRIVRFEQEMDYEELFSGKYASIWDK